MSPVLAMARLQGRTLVRDPMMALVFGALAFSTWNMRTMQDAGSFGIPKDAWLVFMSAGLGAVSRGRVGAQGYALPALPLTTRQRAAGTFIAAAAGLLSVFTGLAVLGEVGSLALASALQRHHAPPIDVAGAAAQVLRTVLLMAPGLTLLPAVPQRYAIYAMPVWAALCWALATTGAFESGAGVLAFATLGTATGLVFARQQGPERATGTAQAAGTLGSAFLGPERALLALLAPRGALAAVVIGAGAGAYAALHQGHSRTTDQALPMFLLAIFVAVMPPLPGITRPAGVSSLDGSPLLLLPIPVRRAWSLVLAAGAAQLVLAVAVYVLVIALVGPGVDPDALSILAQSLPGWTGLLLLVRSSHVRGLVRTPWVGWLPAGVAIALQAPMMIVSLPLSFPGPWRAGGAFLVLALSLAILGLVSGRLRPS